jgi:DNA-binding MarR family transcriptional regulator
MPIEKSTKEAKNTYKHKKFVIHRHLSLMYRAGQSFYADKTKDFDIGGGQLSLVFFLFHNPGISQDECSKHLEVDKTTIARAIRKLENQGVITRKKDDQDHRVNRLSLTEKGIQIQNKLRHVSDEWQSLLLHNFEEDEKKELERLFKKLAENARLSKLEKLT